MKTNRRITFILFFFFSFSLLIYSQNNTNCSIRGKITDSDKEPVYGVNVIVDQGKYATTTDKQGNYNLTLNSGKHTITFTHIEHKTIQKQYELTAEQTLDISLQLDKKVYNLDDITITGSAMPIETGKLSSSVSIIKSKELETQQIQTPDDALSYIPGVYIRRLKGLATIPGHTQVQMRGTGAANRTLVLKDGIPINDAYTGGVPEWNTTATNSLSSIEVVRGPGSALYGSGSMGGTINLISEKPTEKPTLGANVIYGSNNTSIIGAKAGKLFANGIGVMAIAEYKHTDGYQYMADDLWEDYYEDPENNLLNVNVKLSLLTGKHAKIEATADYHQQKATTGTSKIYEMNYKTGNHLLRYSGGTNQLFNFDVAVYYNHQKRETDAYKWNADDEKFNTDYYQSHVPIDVFGFMGKVNKTIKSNSLTIGADIKQTNVDSKKYTNSSGDTNFSGNQNFVSFFFNDDVSLWEVFNLNLGVRYDHWENNDGKFYNNTTGEDVSINYDNASSDVLSPKLGLSYRPIDELRVRASYAMGFKAPSIYYMYNASVLGSSYRLGNPELKPERMTYSVDFGVDYSLNNKLNISATYYQSSFKDFMDNVTIDASEVPSYFDPGDLPVKQYINIGEVHLKGVEASLNYTFLPHLSANVSYFYNQSEIIKYESNTDYVGNQLDDNPKVLISAGINYSNDKILNAEIRLKHTGEYYSDMENSDDLIVEASNVIDIKLSKQIKKFTITANMLNVFDELYYGTFSSATSYYYAPSRTVNFGIKYNL